MVNLTFEDDSVRADGGKQKKSFAEVIDKQYRMVCVNEDKRKHSLLFRSWTSEMTKSRDKRPALCQILDTSRRKHFKCSEALTMSHFEVYLLLRSHMEIL